MYIYHYNDYPLRLFIIIVYTFYKSFDYFRIRMDV